MEYYGHVKPQLFGYTSNKIQLKCVGCVLWLVSEPWISSALSAPPGSMDMKSTAFSPGRCETIGDLGNGAMEDGD